jgi:UTP--glucose-1-phosphate uridylyltransferase
MKSVRKAVFPVAGLGSRFLPATKANPKEMLPVVDKPLIQYAVEEAVAAGCTDLIFVTGRTKRSIADHFDKAYELEHELEMKQKKDLLALCNTVPKHVNCIYIRQSEPLGLGHAVLCAAPVVNDEPFAVLLADDLIDGEPPILKQMTDIFDRFGRSILGVQHVPRSQTGSYGIVSTDADVGGLYGVTGIIEKPKPEVAPSTLAVVGRYILTPRIFDHLRTHQAGSGRRTPADRRHRGAADRRGRAGLSVQGQAVRLRLEAGLSAGDRRARAQASGSRRCIFGLDG